MKIKAKKIPVYEISTPGGELLGRFEKTGSWEGLLKLEGTHGAIIVQEKANAGEMAAFSFLDSICGIETDREMPVVMATPNILEKLRPEPASAGDGADQP